MDCSTSAAIDEHVALRAERASFLETVRQPRPDRVGRKSLSAGWLVRDVVSHLNA